MGSRADDLSNPLWDELGHAPPRTRTPPPPEAPRVARGPGRAASSSCRRWGRGGGLGHLPPRPGGLTPPRRSRRLPRAPLPGAGPHGVSLTARPTAASQMRMSVPRCPSLLRTPHTHGRPHVTRSGGTVDLSPRARVGGSRPIGRRTTWRGRSRGGIRADRGDVGGLVAPSRAAGCAE